MEELTQLKSDLRSFDRKKQHAAAYQLRYHHDGEATFLLFNASYESADEELVKIAVETLGIVASGKATTAFTKSTHHPDPVRRLVAYRNLGYLGQDAAVEAICRGFSDKDPSVRREAVIAAGKVGDEAVIERLQVLTSVYEPESVRGAATAAIELIRRRRPGAKPFIPKVKPLPTYIPKGF